MIIDKIIIDAKRKFFQTYSQLRALCIDLFNKTNGIPPSKVPTGQINLLKIMAAELQKSQE